MVPILLVTRPLTTASNFEKAVRSVVETPFESIFSPLLEILPRTVGPIDPVDNLIITSSNGARRAAEIGVSVTNSVWCVGHKTTQRAKELGLKAKYAGDDAQQLLNTIRGLSQKESYLHLSGAHTRGEIVETLKENGFNASRIIAYDQKRLGLTKEAITALEGTIPVVLPLFSPRTADLLKDYNVVAPVRVVAISAAVKEAVPGGISAEIECVKRPDQAHMVEATAQALARMIR